MTTRSTNRFASGRTVGALAVLVGALGMTAPATASSGTWTVAGSMTTARADHTATLLADGGILVAGGVAAGVGGERPTTSAEVHSASGIWRSTAGLTLPRSEHTATRLDTRCGARCGDVLVAGGLLGGSPANATAGVELYDADTGTWSPGAPLLTARYNHTATVLQDGRVLVAGGRGAFFTAAAEVYDPEAGTWSATGSLNGVYFDHTATLLTDGRVLVVGATSNGSAAELYDPETGSWALTAAPTVQRFEHSATLLATGKVLVVGTAGGTEASGDGRSAEVYDPDAGTWRRATALTMRRAFHTATPLLDGTVLVSGGATTPDAALYDPATDVWSATGALAANRREHTATLLPGGQVLVTGGRTVTGLVASAEQYEPPPPLRPAVAVGDVAVPEGHAGSRPATFAVTLSVASLSPVTVEYAVVAGTAGSGDYVPSAGMVTLAPGTTSATVEVAVAGDVLEEGDETFSLVLSATSGATIHDGVGSGVIVDDDPSGARHLDVGDATVYEGDAGGRTVVATVSLSRPAAAPVTVSYATADATATAPGDYSPAAGTITFAPGETGRTIAVSVHPDGVTEGPEAVVIALSRAVGAPIDDGTGTIVVVDDD